MLKEIRLQRLLQSCLNLEAIVSVLTCNHPFKSRLSLIVRVNVVLNRSVVVDSD